MGGIACVVQPEFKCKAISVIECHCFLVWHITFCFLFQYIPNISPIEPLYTPCINSPLPTGFVSLGTQKSESELAPSDFLVSHFELHLWDRTWRIFCGLLMLASCYFRRLSLSMTCVTCNAGRRLRRGHASHCWYALLEWHKWYVFTPLLLWHHDICLCECCQLVSLSVDVYKPQAMTAGGTKQPKMTGCCRTVQCSPDMQSHAKHVRLGVCLHSSQDHQQVSMDAFIPQAHGSHLNSFLLIRFSCDRRHKHLQRIMTFFGT